MNPALDRIAQFRKMASDDPENELGHYRLGQELMNAGQLEEAVASFRRTLQLSPQFAKVYQLLGSCLVSLGRKDEAVKLLKEGFQIADEHGHFMPRDEIAKLLIQLGETPPAGKKAEAASGSGEPGTGFRCQRPGCGWGNRAKKLPAPPMPDALGQRIFDSVCAECWNDWLRNFSVKVINELRLDLSTEKDQALYDHNMTEFLGLH